MKEYIKKIDLTMQLNWWAKDIICYFNFKMFLLMPYQIEFYGVISRLASTAAIRQIFDLVGGHKVYMLISNPWVDGAR